MIKAYNDVYVGDVAESLGIMFECAVDNGLDPKIFWNTFINSNVAKQIEKGNPKYLCCSFFDYLQEMYHGRMEFSDEQEIALNEFYWAGWILAQYQQRTGKSFYKINNTLPIEKVLNLYPTLHEADITKFFDVADEYFKKTQKETNLKTIRTAAGFSQSELAKKAEVELRSIQMYEQRRNDINKAQVETIYKLSRALGCNIEDLLED